MRRKKKMTEKEFIQACQSFRLYPEETALLKELQNDYLAQENTAQILGWTREKLLNEISNMIKEIGCEPPE